MLADRDAWLQYYADRGLTTLPLRPREKRPLRSGWRTPFPDAWMDTPADANVGILCGVASGGLVVLDFDSRDGPREVLCMRAEELAVHTLVVRTARGWHVYARDASARTCSPQVGLDVRAEGSLVVAPPSIHPAGVGYELVNADAPIAALADLGFALVSRKADCQAVDWSRVESWIAIQSPRLQDAWRRLREPTGEFDRSSADFAVARCLHEAGFTVEEIIEVLCALPGSKARERGADYARRTAVRAGAAR